MSELREALTTTRKKIVEEKQEPVSADFTGKKVLLVEDNALNREIAVEILQEVGLTVDTANDGDVAVEKLRGAAENQYDLVLMDVQMPKLDGYTATREIRTLDNPFVANIPIIAMTANAFEEDKRKSFEAGMDGHLSKPIEIPKLIETLASILK
nr:response regulator [Blautia sp. MSJ-19]